MYLCLHSPVTTETGSKGWHCDLTSLGLEQGGLVTQQRQEPLTPESCKRTHPQPEGVEPTTPSGSGGELGPSIRDDVLGQPMEREVEVHQ